MMNEKKLFFTNGEHRLELNGPVGTLEAIVLGFSEAGTDNLAVLCHPHPLEGGTMQNKVVTTLARTFRDLGIPSVRFNFRGVGQSEGEYAKGLGETDDLMAVLQWVQTLFPETKVQLAGFSFGAFVSYRASAEWPLGGLISIAPPVNHWDFSATPEPSCPWIVVQGEADEIVPASEVFAWLESLATQATLIRFPDTSHFFHGKLVALKAALNKAIAAQFL